MELAMGGHRLDSAARAVVIALGPSTDADADGVLGVDAVRIADLDHPPDAVALVLTSGGGAAWFRACLEQAGAAVDRVVLDPQAAPDPDLAGLGRPVAVTIDGSTVGARVAQQTVAMSHGARVILTDHPREARRVADVLDAMRGCPE